MSSLIIGLTGGIGSGKSFVSDCFADKGVDIIDADVIARQVVEPGQPAFQKIVERFGNSILDTHGLLDRTRLRQLVFDNQEHQTWLNQLLHPKIREKMVADARNASSAYCILAIPLLVENNLFSLVDKVLVVDVPVECQIERASQRDGQSAEMIKKIIAVQASRQARLDVADDVIDNAKSRTETKNRVDVLHENYLHLAKSMAKA